MEKLTMDSTEWTYTYDTNGLRTGRSGGGKTYQYVYSGSLLRKMTIDGHTLVFDYDANGHPLTVTYDGYVFFYVTNLQGDVVGIVSGNGVQIASYAYDAWGRVYNANDHTNGQIPLNIYNPLCYRGYVYDRETGLYYLQSRYYNPQWGRFINADSQLNADTPIELNLFAYCNNNPVNFVDHSGHSATAIVLSVIAVAGLFATIAGVATDNNTLTAIGLTAVAIPAVISGIGAVVSGATYLGIIGGVTFTAGLGSGVFASAEYQEAFTGNNWMIDAGMSEGVYNTLMITTATIATLGTVSCSALSSIGKMSTPSQMEKSFIDHPNRWKVLKEQISPAINKRYRGGTSIYSNHINRWTGARAGFHRIIKDGVFIHGPHYHKMI